MAALTASASKNPEGGMTKPLSDARKFEWSLTQESTADTFDTGFGTKVGIVDYAIRYGTGQPVGAASLSAGVFTLVSSASGGTYDLLVWVK